jgi:hypothetical protein
MQKIILSVCSRARVRACMHACVRAFVRVCVCVQQVYLDDTLRIQKDSRGDTLIATRV